MLLVEEGGVGGVADYTTELATALAGEGWEVMVASARDHAYPAIPGVTVRGVFPYVRGRTWLGRLIRRAGLGRAINGLGHLGATIPLLALARQSAVVHVQGGEWPPLGALQATLLRAAGRPPVWTPHNTFDRDRHAYGQAIARRLTERAASRIVLHSEYDRGSLSRHVLDKSVVIPHGEYGGLARRSGDHADPQRTRRALGLSATDVVVLLFGQLRPDKGVADLLEAAAVTEGLQVLLAGEDKGALDEVAGLLASPALARRTVVIDHFIPLEQTTTLFAAADVVALPYRRASASGVLLLASAYARAVVAYPVGGLPDYIIDGETGWVCRRPAPEALADQLAAIVAAGRETCRARGLAAQRLAEASFSWGEIAHQTAAIYVGLLAGSGADGGLPDGRGAL